MAGVVTGKGELAVIMGILYNHRLAYDCVQSYTGMLGCRLACFCEGGRVVGPRSHVRAICVIIMCDVDAMGFIIYGRCV